jgi:hypothetical protein
MRASWTTYVPGLVVPPHVLVEDDVVSRELCSKFLWSFSGLGCAIDVAVDGVNKTRMHWQKYDLALVVCLPRLGDRWFLVQCTEYCYANLNPPTKESDVVQDNLHLHL